MSTLVVDMLLGSVLLMAFNPRKRCKRYDIEGDAHCLTFSCYWRLPLFSRKRSCRWMCDALEMGFDKGFYDLWAYVIMPEHVHVVLLPHSGVKIARILTMLKQSVSKRAILWLEEHAKDFLNQLVDRQPNGKQAYRFWQRGGGYDRNLRTISDIYEKIAYVHGTPVKRGLTLAAQDWPGSSCRAWETGVDKPIPDKSRHIAANDRCRSIVKTSMSTTSVDMAPTTLH
jgi:putative transposase